jgi:hypothetical protein
MNRAGLLFISLLSLTFTNAFSIEGVFKTEPDALQKLAERQKDPEKKKQFLAMASSTAEVLTISNDKLIWATSLGNLTWDLSQKGEFILATHDYPDGSRGYAAMYIKDNDTLYVGQKRYLRDKTEKEK